jgi:hypothetical protein
MELQGLLPVDTLLVVEEVHQECQALHQHSVEQEEVEMVESKALQGP